MKVELSGSPLRRIYAMVLRYWFLLRGSWPRILEILYWPTVNVCLWGLISRFLQTNSSWVAQASGLLIAAVLLWDVLFRGQLGMAISFMEEMWSRNLGHLFVSPLRVHEWLIALMAASLVRLTIGMVPAMLVAIALYHYSIFSLGLPLLAFLTGLILMSWWLSLIIIAMILHFGMGAEGLAWMAVFVFAPLSAVYYPVASLPHWLQPVSWALPSAHIFEGMRMVLFQHRFSWELFSSAMALNLAYFLIAALIFAASFRNARRRGSLIQIGE